MAKKNTGKSSQPHPSSPSQAYPSSSRDAIDDQDASGLAEYIKKRRDLLEVLSSLHATGVQKELDLPQIVVVGSQSVGKSSLIESMSGITLPRASGTCTRCPMECRLETASTWSCKVTLRFEFDSLSQSLVDMHEKSFGPVITRKNEVADVLRRAQRAILRSTLDPSVFLDDSDLDIPGHPAQTFSSNTVCIRIEGPNVPDLFFYDLPGIIANVADGGDEGDIKLVEDLAKTYMARQNCIILLVISCETDFENQGAGRLVLQNHSLKSRTVGVLTKVDRIEPGTSGKWVRILEGQDNALKNGWYAVKQPNARELESGISWETARENEDTFFRLQEPWASLVPNTRKRLGCERLTDRLSTLLSDLVSMKLPVIRAEISRLLFHVERELQDIPEPDIKDPRREVITMVRDFRKIVSKHIEGLSPDSPDFPANLPGLIHSINQVYDELKVDIHQTVPRFLPWEAHYESTLTAATLEELVHSTSLESQIQVGTAPAGDLPSTPSAMQIGATKGRTYHVDEVMEIAKRARTRELPGNYPFIATENIIRDFVATWAAHAERCFDKVKDLLNAQLSHLLRLSFGKYEHSGMLDAISEVVTEVIKNHAESTRARISSLAAIESSPFTQNDQYYLDYKEKVLTRYKNLHRKSMGQQTLIDNLNKYQPASYGSDYNYQTFWNNVNTALNALANLGISGRSAIDLARLLSKDPMDPALEIMAEARAYFQVAFKRFSDTVPQEIDTAFLRGFDSSLDLALMYMDFSTETCLDFLQEAPEVVERRRELLGKKRRLGDAQRKLRATGRI